MRKRDTVGVLIVTVIALTAGYLIGWWKNETLKPFHFVIIQEHCSGDKTLGALQ